ncbi:MAG: hypothetical protein ABJQ34_05665 [Paracoccaceae bacterium]
MDRVILGVLSSGPLKFLVLLATMVTGAVLASRLLTVDFKFRRVTYFWSMQLLIFAFAVLQIATVFVTQAVHYGLFVPFCLLIASTYLLLGAGIYFGSAARSNHMSGEATFAWIAFVPLANLWLVFKSGETNPYWYWYEHGIKDAFIVAAALIPGVLASELLSELGERPWSQAALNAFEENAQAVEDKAFLMALGIKQNARSPCPTGMKVIKVDAKDQALLVQCAVKTSGFSRRTAPIDASKQTQNICASRRFRTFLDEGGEISLSYSLRRNTKPQNLSIFDADCVS